MPPLLELQVAPTPGIVNRTALFSCVVREAFPQANQIEWYRINVSSGDRTLIERNQRLRFNSSHPEFQIANLQANDQDFYECLAMNAAGIGRNTVFLPVVGEFPCACILTDCL